MKARLREHPSVGTSANAGAALVRPPTLWVHVEGGFPFLIDGTIAQCSQPERVLPHEALNY